MSGDELARLLARQEAAFERLFDQLREASAGQPDSAAKLSSAVRTALAFAGENPEEARLLLRDVLGGEPELSMRIFGYHRRLAGLMREQCEARDRMSLPEVTEQALIGGAAALVGTYFARGREADLAGLEDELAEFLLRPYLGGGPG